MKPKIICIVGPSGCGKTTLVKFIKAEMGIPFLVSYTTREMRKGEADGIDHYFTSQSMMPPMSQMLAYTSFGGHYYWTELKDVEKEKMVTYVIDEAGLLNLIENYSDRFDIRSILITRDNDKLIKTVGEERVNRDRSRLKLDDDMYDFIINNNGSLLDFFKKAKQAINTMI